MTENPESIISVCPLAKVQALYGEGCPRTFDDDLFAHFVNDGYVISTPHMFFMGRPVDHRAPREKINNPWHKFHAEQWTCWYVYAFAAADGQRPGGLVKKLLRAMPFYLPFVAWERRGGPLRFFSTEKLTERYALHQNDD